MHSQCILFQNAQTHRVNRDRERITPQICHVWEVGLIFKYSVGIQDPGEDLARNNRQNIIFKGRYYVLFFFK